MNTSTKEKKMTPQEQAQTLREIILSAKDLQIVAEVVPEWGNITVYIKPMTAKERDEWQAQYYARNMERTEKGGELDPLSSRLDNITASLMVTMLKADPEGKIRIFSDDDIEALGEKSAAVINRLQEKLKKASGTSPEDEKALLKNLKGQGEISG